jgi:mRNA interferase MazF
MNQGDVYWHTYKEPDKKRPVVLLTRDEAIPYLTSITVASITTTIRPIESHVILQEEDGMPQECAVSLDNINTIPKNKLGTYLTHLSIDRMREIRAAIQFVFGFDALD